jgi:hypothetical protein
MKRVSEELSNSQFYSINQRRIIRIYLRAMDCFETGQRCTRNPKERDLDHIPLLSKSIE